MGASDSVPSHRTWNDWMKHRMLRIQRHGGVGGWLKSKARSCIKPRSYKRAQPVYAGDGLNVEMRNMSFLSEPTFASAWAEAVRLNDEGWDGKVPNIEWRAHVACWAARHGLSVEGDFVECGVHTGLLSLTVCRYLGFEQQPRSFWLFDTWNGLPTEGLSSEQLSKVERANSRLYPHDVYELAVRNFAQFPNAKLVRGTLPGTLGLANIERIAYLSVDLNNAWGEKAVIEQLWPKISKGAMIVIDDYGWAGYEDQHDMWDAFAYSVGAMIVTLPTGQGILIR